MLNEKDQSDGQGIKQLLCPTALKQSKKEARNDTILDNCSSQLANFPFHWNNLFVSTNSTRLYKHTFYLGNAEQRTN